MTMCFYHTMRSLTRIFARKVIEVAAFRFMVGDIANVTSLNLALGRTSEFEIRALN